MTLRRLRYRDLVALNIISNRATLSNWIRDRSFPPGQLTGPNTRTWSEDEVRRWLNARPTAPKPAPPSPKNRRGRTHKTDRAEGAGISRRKRAAAPIKSPPPTGGGAA